ncbi:3-dehydro-L-gulonate 2-dehydrogenase [Natranaerovirga hydrolytica]|uniref:3-dehydro-L-gulonate 2-dehydrogenase n=1 Tax=Natranaerovirga hydrolytica TaxID=680378 RepID=A0A4R1N7Q5_9FIRM|nr:3-dehydro-L-gulonate 2-dehydrogenase [Natranaerovirga hydrolytica]TCK98703.1 3-dehydro-L-gulonate 2-dehydrogenase [Natranaerovirga hydrolytica]
MRVSFETMYKEFLRVLLKKGFAQERAELCAKLFAETSRDGVYSHGLNRFPRFISLIDQGIVNVAATPEKIDTVGFIERWDGNLGPGNLNAYYCMERAIALAKENGMGVVTLKNNNHWMRGGSYGWQAAHANCIGICWTNTLPNMPPWGSTEAKIGNNPMIFAVPRENGEHIVLDMAMSQFSYGQLSNYELKNQSLPVDGGFDTEGHLTKDPVAIQASKRPLPIGYWKGSGLSLMLDLVAMTLSGGRSTLEIGDLDAEYSVSQLFMAFDLSKMPEQSAMYQSIEHTIKDLQNANPSEENNSVRYPGEGTLKKRAENLEKGIPVEPSIWEEVLNL